MLVYVQEVSMIVIQVVYALIIGMFIGEVLSRLV